MADIHELAMRVMLSVDKADFGNDGVIVSASALRLLMEHITEIDSPSTEDDDRPICPMCEQHKNDVSTNLDPYDLEINNTESYITCCDDCYQSRRDDI